MVIPLLHAIARILVAVLLLPATKVFSQGLVSGFMQGAGRTTVALSYSSESFAEYWVGQQPTTNSGLGTITTQSASLFVATGITSFADVILAIPYASASSSAGFWETISSVQDVSAALRLRALSFDVDGTTIDIMGSTGISTPVVNYVNNAPVTIGHGATSIDGRLTVQAKHQSGVFGMLQSGYVHRNPVAIDWGSDVNVPNLVETVARIGYASERFYTDYVLHNIVAQSGTTIGPGVPFPTNSQSLIRLGGTVAWNQPWVDNLTLIGGVATIVSGSNVGRATRMTFGIAYGLPQWGGLSL
jgi:hypothetical protein